MVKRIRDRLSRMLNGICSYLKWLKILILAIFIASLLFLIVFFVIALMYVIMRIHFFIGGILFGPVLMLLYELIVFITSGGIPFETCVAIIVVVLLTTIVITVIIVKRVDE